MSTLREIKDRISSVRSTLKITSATKLVSAAKLHKAERALYAFRPYESTFSSILSSVLHPDPAPQTGPSAADASVLTSGPGVPSSIRPGLAGPDGDGASASVDPAASASPSADASATAPLAPGTAGSATSSISAASTPLGISSEADPYHFFPPYGATLPPVPGKGQKIAIVAIASNSTLCGAFNSGILRGVQAVLDKYPKDAVDIYPLGRKIADPLRKRGYSLCEISLASIENPTASAHASEAPTAGSPAPATPAIARPLHAISAATSVPDPTNLNDLVSHPNYYGASQLASVLSNAFHAGTYSAIILVYNHFLSRSKHQVVTEHFLPFVSSFDPDPDPYSDAYNDLEISSRYGPHHLGKHIDYILEPSAHKIIERLKPQMLRIHIYSMLLNSIASEHAARTIAMQTASDNAERLLSELTLEYNKQRQQQITTEILDILGGSQQ